MKTKKLLKDRGVDHKAVESCADLPSLVVLGQKHGVLSAPEAQEIEVEARLEAEDEDAKNEDEEDKVSLNDFIPLLACLTHICPHPT